MKRNIHLLLVVTLLIVVTSCSNGSANPIDQFKELARVVGFPGAFAFFLFLFICYLVRQSSKVYQKNMSDIKEIYTTELERHVKEKQALQEIFLKQIPSSSKDHPENKGSAGN